MKHYECPSEFEMDKLILVILVRSRFDRIKYLLWISNSVEYKQKNKNQLQMSNQGNNQFHEAL